MDRKQERNEMKDDQTQEETEQQQKWRLAYKEGETIDFKWKQRALKKSKKIIKWMQMILRKKLRETVWEIMAEMANKQIDKHIIGIPAKEKSKQCREGKCAPKSYYSTLQSPKTLQK